MGHMNSTQLAFKSMHSEQIKLYKQTCQNWSDRTELMAVLQTHERNDDNDDDNVTDESTIHTNITWIKLFVKKE